MLVGVPREIKPQERRVGLTPGAARELVHHGHAVVVETGAGAGIGESDGAYLAAGASIASRDDVFARAALIVKVKEPQAEECARLRPGQVIFTYLHLAADRAQAEALMRSGAVAIGYETVTDAQGRLPLLAPMSEVAGRMSVQVAAHCLQSPPGAGILMGGVPGVAAARVLILGGGVAGGNAARVAVGMGADVTVIDRLPACLATLDERYGGRIHTLHATRAHIDEAVPRADVLIGAVLVPGAAAPRLVSRALIGAMRPGSVAVDIAIDQGGCLETSRPTSHDAPIYVEEGVVH